MYDAETQPKPKRGRMPQSVFNWVAAALGVAVLLAPVTSVFQVAGGSEVVDVELEECSVEVAESAREEWRDRSSLLMHVAQWRGRSATGRSAAQLRSRITERSFLNGIGGWLRL